MHISIHYNISLLIQSSVSSVKKGGLIHEFFAQKYEAAERGLATRS